MVRLGDVCEIVSGTTPSTNKPEFWDGNIKWITPAEISNSSYFIYETERHITEKAGLKSMPAGTVLLSSRAPIGKVAIAGEPMCCNQGFKNLICSDKIHNRYLYRYLKNQTEYLNSLGRGATFKEISKTIVENIKIPLPPLHIQKKIADVLDRVNALIEKRKAQIEKLDLLVKSQFIQMFGDPITNPMGWECVDLETVCTKITDGEHVTPSRTTEGIFLLSARNILSHRIDVTDVDFIDESEYERISKRIIPSTGDILISCSGSVGRVARITDDTRYQMVRSVAILQLTNEIDSVFVEYCFDTNYMQTQIWKSVNQSSQANLFQGKIRKLKIPLPPLHLQNQFAAFVEQVEAQKAHMKHGLELMELEYKSLMQKCFSGDIFL